MGEAAFGGYTEQQLKASFALVKDPENWKLRIDAVVPASADQGAISAAVVFYTGSSAEFIKVRRGWRVVAAGYYACIGS